VTRHEANSVKRNAPSSEEVWYLDSSASNHMTRHKERFSCLEKPKNPEVVSTGDGTLHPIANVGEVPLSSGRVFPAIAMTLECRRRTSHPYEG
jgi:hypothetical protein